MIVNPQKPWLWIVHWHSGDSSHAYENEQSALEAIRYHYDRPCTLHVVNWLTGERREIHLKGA